MNHLARAEDEGWRLPQHAHLVVHEREQGGLLTVYDCGAAQKPPSAQLVGRLVRVELDHERRQQPTGYVISLREPGLLERQPERRWVVRARD